MNVLFVKFLGRVLHLAGLASLVLASSLAMGQTVTLVPSDDDPGENIGSITLTATLDTAASADVTVTVSSSESYLRVPSANTLTIASGATTSTGSLTLTLVDDIIAGQDRTAVLSATVASTDTNVTAPDDVTITLLEDDELRLNLQLAGDWPEGTSQQACVTLSTPFVGTIDLTVMATETPSDDLPSGVTENNYEAADLRLPDPPTLTLTQGETQGCWDTVVVQNSEVDGPRYATLSFGNPVTTTVKNVIVGDNTSVTRLVDNDAPVTGAPALYPTTLMPADNMSAAITAITGGVAYNIVTRRAGGTLTPGESLPGADAMARSYQLAAAADGTYTEMAHHADATAYTPAAADAGKYLRVCVFFQNRNGGPWQGAPASAAGTAYSSLTQAQRESGTLCSTGLLVGAIPVVRLAPETMYTYLENQGTGMAGLARLGVPDGMGGFDDVTTDAVDVVVTLRIESDNNPADNPTITSDDADLEITLTAGPMTIAAGTTEATGDTPRINVPDNLITLHANRTLVIAGTVEYRKPGTTEVITEGLSWAPPLPYRMNILDDDFLTVGFSRDSYMLPENGDEVEICAVKDRVALSTVETTVQLTDPDNQVLFENDSKTIIITIPASDSMACVMARTTVPDNYEFDGARSVTATITDVAPTSDLIQLGIATTRMHIADDEAGGRPALAASGSTAALTGLTEDTAYSVAVAKPESGSNSGATVEDGNGLPVDGDGALDKSQIHVSYQDSRYNAGPFSELSTHTADETITPAQDQVGRYVRICVFFEDQSGQHEGAGGDARAAFADLTPLQRGRDGRLCSTPLLVTNANDAPVAGDRTISVFDGTDGGSSTTNLHRFVIDDFPFTDEDGDNLASITIKSLPTGMNMDGTSEARGTLVLTSDGGGSANVAVDDSITLANLPKLGYYASVRAGPRAPYGTFTFTVTDDGSDGSSNTTSTNTGTITINLVAPSGQYAATGSPTVTAASGTAFEEDVALSASETGVSDLNGIKSGSLEWQWQRTTFEVRDHRYDADAWVDISGATSASYTPVDADVDKLLRACLSFDDEHSTSNEEGPVCSAGRMVTNVNDEPTGLPAIFIPGDLMENIMLGSEHDDVGDLDGRSTLVHWQWQQADPDGTDPTMVDTDTWADIEGATRESFRPDDAQVGKFLRTCASYVDNRGTPEGPVCSNPTATAVVNVNDAPTGSVVVVLHETSTVVTTVAQSQAIEPAITAKGGSLMDEDGLPDAGANDLSNFANSISWQTATSPSGPWTEYGPSWDASAGGGQSFGYATDEMHAVGSAVRYCLFYTDGHETAEGGPSSTAAERQAGTICSAPLVVINGNSEPLAVESRANVFSTVTEAAPHRFRAADFMFTDANDGDSLAAVIVTSLPTVGTLQFGGADITVPQRVEIDQLRMLSYHPAAGAAVSADSYDAFNFKVVDDGTSPDADTKTESTDAATLSIYIVTPVAAAATGTPAATAEQGTAYDEDATLTAGLGTVVDHNGINMATISWQWQQARDADPAAPAVPGPDSSSWSNVAGEGDDGSEFTPAQAHVGTYIRVCLSFDDGGGNAEGPLCSVPPSAIANVNDAPVATLGMAPGQRGQASATGNLQEHTTYFANITAGGASLSDEDGLPAAATDDSYWVNADGAREHDGISWQQSLNGGLNWRELGWRTESYTATTANIGTLIRFCLFYTDASGAMEGGSSATAGARFDGTLCSDALQVENTNAAPTGRVGIRDPGNVDTPITTLTEGRTFSLADTTGGGTLADPDGLPTGTARYTDSGEGISWQTAATADGPWTEARITSDRPGSGNNASYTPEQPQVGQYVRVCLFYFDLQGTLEGGDSTSPATRAAATSESTCSIGLQVTNVNDAPVALATGVSVTVERTAEDAHAFRLADFRYEDEDEDNLVSIIIETVPTAGTMRVGTTEVATGNVPYTVLVVNVGTITFYPEAGQDPTDTSDLTANYATFTFKVVDDGMDPDANTNTESAAATISIRLTTATQMDASGMPTVTPAPHATDGWAEDAELTAALTGVVEPNGIDEASVEWQWQSAAAPASGTPAAAAWSDIADATDTTFTPLQAHVGMHIRACVSFRDQHATPAEEGPLCSTSAQVSNVNDAPTSAMATVNAFTVATADSPFRFSADHFPFMDEDAGQDSWRRIGQHNPGRSADSGHPEGGR